MAVLLVLQESLSTYLSIKPIQNIFLPRQRTWHIALVETNFVCVPLSVQKCGWQSTPTHRVKLMLSVIIEVAGIPSNIQASSRVPCYPGAGNMRSGKWGTVLRWWSRGATADWPRAECSRYAAVTVTLLASRSTNLTVKSRRATFYITGAMIIYPASSLGEEFKMYI